MKRILFVLAFSIFSINSFADGHQIHLIIETLQQQASIELYIDADGKVLVDGKKIGIKKLEKRLIEIKNNKGLVKFANAKNNRKMAGKRLEVMKLLRKHQLSVEVYTDKTFSKIIRL